MPSAIPESALPTIDSTKSPSNPQSSSHARRASLKVLSRNIDTVVLGNLIFPTWYYSPYPDSILLGEDYTSNHNISSQGQRQGHDDVASADSHDKALSGVDVNGELKPVKVSPIATGVRATTIPTTNRSVTGTATASVPLMPCQRLHVCPYCFRYTPKAGDYVQHLRRHDVTYDPHSGRESSPSHLDGKAEVVAGAADESDGDSNSSEDDSSTWPVPETAVKVYEWGGYAVWDVDGEKEKLYCQNLSLFGKLFLEQKSVFFDTGGFHYFVLTYTPPSAPEMATAKHEEQQPQQQNNKTTPGRGSAARGRRRTLSNNTNPHRSTGVDRDATTAAGTPPDISLRTQVQGFFSKENLSWDANNLACILVFPPYQHRNLGQLLMAVSYKLSGWEWEDSIIGGPEKPLSAMGRRSYLRFWSERVARFVMGQTADADGQRVFGADAGGGAAWRKKRKKKPGFGREEMTVKKIGDRTGMLTEDVVAALGEMGVMEVVRPKKKKRKSDGVAGVVAGAGAAEEGEEEEMLSTMVVQRSRVLEWAKRKGVELVSPVREEGFLGEWALSEPDEDSEGLQEGVDSE